MKKLTFYLIAILFPFLGISQSSMVEEFSWRDRHGGLNYTTSVQNQVINDPCAIFASCEAAEAMYSIYYNRPNTNINLAERFIYSIRGVSNPYSISISDALNTLKDTGVVSEAAYPYINDSATGIEYNDHYYWGNYASSYAFDIATVSPYLKLTTWNSASFGSGTITDEIRDNLKWYIINKGPVIIHLDSPSHNVLFTGWSTEGSTTVWEFISSMSIGDVDLGVNHMDDSEFTLTYLTCYYMRPSSGSPFSALRGYSTTQLSHDYDDDGYYVWGFGPKPPNTGDFYVQDGDDDNPVVGPMDSSTGYCDTICDINEDDMVITSGPSYVCPNTDYQIFFSWPSNANYKDIEISGQASIVNGGTSSIIVLTDVNFGYFTITMKAKNALDCDWTEKSLSYWYDYLNCNKSATIIDTISDKAIVTSIDDEFLDSEILNVYPNPVFNNASFTIDINDNIAIEKVDLINIQGQTIKTFTSEKELKNISTYEMAKGIYFVQVLTKNNIYHNRKIVIE